VKEVPMFSRPFDDLAVGQRFSTRGRTITEADVVSFAALTGDHHPQHVDARWAAASPFGGRIAHGLLVLSYAAGLVPFDADRVVALRRVRDAVFKRPVRLGDTISVDGRVAEVTPLDDDTGLVAVALVVSGEDGRTVARATVEVLWRRDGTRGPAIADTGMVHALTSVPL
jgi:3-hydroxybutyryl-CoA dehydratase